MGCSDRYDLDYCEFKTGTYTNGYPKTCGRRTDGGIYCKDHTHNVLPKDDAAEVIKKLQDKQKEKLHVWLKE